MTSQWTRIEDLTPEELALVIEHVADRFVSWHTEKLEVMQEHLRATAGLVRQAPTAEHAMRVATWNIPPTGVADQAQEAAYKAVPPKWRLCIEPITVAMGDIDTEAHFWLKGGE